MSKQTWQETLVSQSIQGTLFNTYTTAKTVIPATSLYTFPPNYFEEGKKIMVSVQGGVSSLVTTPGTLTMQVMLGSIVVFTTGAMQMNATAHTLIPFWADFVLTCRAIGVTTSANFMGQGRVHGTMFTVTAAQVDGINSHAYLMGPNTAPAVGTGFDSTIANILDFWTGFSISNAANGIQVEQYTVTALN